MRKRDKMTMPKNDGRSPVQFICPNCSASFRSKVYPICSGMIIVCQYCRWAFQVELQILGNRDQWGECDDAKE